MNFPLSAEDAALLTGIGIAIVQLFKIVWVGLLKKPKPSKEFSRGLVFVIAVVYAYFDAEIVLPPLEDPMLFAIALFEAGLAVLIIAHNAYDLLIAPILEWLDSNVVGRLFGGRTFLAP